MFTNKMMMDSLNIAKSLAPIDSGNLRHNAIKLLRRKNGFTIKYSAVDAYYITFQEEGFVHYKSKAVVDTNKGFISRTYLTLSNYFQNIEDGKAQSKRTNEKINMELYRENSDYRKLVHTNSIFQHYQTEGMTNPDGSPRLYRGRGE